MSTSITQMICRVHGGALCEHNVVLADALDTDSGRVQRRRDRLAAQAVLWSVSRIDRVRHCGRYLSNDATGVQLRVTNTPEGRRGGFAGLQTCGSVWACPMCSAKVLARRQTEVETAVTHWLADDHDGGWTHPDLAGGKVAMATFTVRHNSAQSAREVWDAVAVGWTGVTTGDRWQDTKVRFGVPAVRVLKSGPRKGERVSSSILPWVRVAEVTHGDNGWHVHLHVVLFLPSHVSDDGLADLYGGMWSRWNAALVAAGYDGGLQVNTAAFMTGREVAKRLSEYVTKNTYTGASSALALEITRGDLKAGRFGNRSAMGILADVAVNSDMPDDDPTKRRDLALWHEYEQASAGRRQMTWAVGARDLLGLGAEVEDKDIAAEEVGTEDDAVVVLPGDSWAMLRTRPGRRAALLEAVERSVGDALALLLEWEIDHEALTPGELARRRALLRRDPR